MKWVAISFLLGWPQDRAHATPAREGQSGCGTNLQTVGMLWLFKYPVMNTQRKREKRHTIKKREKRKLKKRQGKRKRKPWVIILFLLCLVAKSRPFFCDPMDGNPTGFSVYGILQARILEWAAISFARGSSWIRDPTHIDCIGRQILYPCPT